MVVLDWKRKGKGSVAEFQTTKYGMMEVSVTKSIGGQHYVAKLGEGVMIGTSATQEESKEQVEDYVNQLKR